MTSPAPALIRDTLLASVLGFLAGHDPRTLETIRRALEREIDRAGPDALLALRDRLRADDGWSFYPSDPLARRIHHALADLLLQKDSGLFGIEHVTSLPAGPLTIFANHLSYADANLIEILLQRFGAEALANRLTAIAGPKIFSDRQRRFSSLCFGTVKVPQSADVSSGEAVMSSREVARAARQSIDTAHDRLRAGDALLLFGEGTRSRTAEMHPMLPAVARYLEVPGTWVLPAGLTGTEALFPIDHVSIHPARVVVTFGRPVSADALLAHAGGDRRVAMDAIALAIAELLPSSYRGVYANPADFPHAADMLRASRG